MSPSFFVWNNGRSIFNLFHITRIWVDDSGMKTRYYVKTSDSATWAIEHDEYVNLVDLIARLFRP